MAQIQAKLSYLHRNYRPASLHLTFKKCDFHIRHTWHGWDGTVPIGTHCSSGRRTAELLPPGRYTCTHLRVCRGLFWAITFQEKIKLKSPAELISRFQSSSAQMKVLQVYFRAREGFGSKEAKRCTQQPKHGAQRVTACTEVPELKNYKLLFSCYLPFREKRCSKLYSSALH